jgi:hypothetical protein
MKPFGRHNGQRSFPSEERSKPSPEWNHYRIVANDGVLRLSVNGKEVSGGEDCTWRKGYIGLESEGSPTEFRNIRLKELPSTSATAEQSAPVEEGFVPLYNGLNLRGWKSNNDLAERWNASDWRLKLTSTDKKPGPILWTEAAYGNVDFVADFQLPESADTQQACGGFEIGGYRIILSENQFPGRLKPGKWQRLEVTVTPTNWTVHLDGKLAADVAANADSKRAPRSIGLLDAGKPVEFANLYIRSAD